VPFKNDVFAHFGLGVAMMNYLKALLLVTKTIAFIPASANATALSDLTAATASEK
jgi:hypothetical protein